MSDKCFITQLLGSASDSSLPKLGEVRLPIKPADTEGGIGYFRAVVIEGETVIFTLSADAYFCTSIADNTPINVTKEASRNLELSATSNVFIAFDADVASLLIGNKYGLRGLATYYNLYPNHEKVVKYDISLSDLKYLQNWVNFTAPVTEYKFGIQELPLKTLGCCLQGVFNNKDLTSCHVGSSDYNKGAVQLTGITGEIASIQGYVVNISGNYTFDIANLTVDGQTITLSSKNVEGDYSSIDITQSDNSGCTTIQLGSTSNHCKVVCANIATFIPKTSLNIYSDYFTLAHVRNICASMANAGNTACKNIRIVSSLVAAADVKADSTVQGYITSGLAKGLTIFTINGTSVLS